MNLGGCVAYYLIVAPFFSLWENLSRRGLFGGIALAVAGFLPIAMASASAVNSRSVEAELATVAEALLSASASMWSATGIFLISAVVMVSTALFAAGLARGLLIGGTIVLRALRLPILRPVEAASDLDLLVACQLTDLHQCDRSTIPYELKEDPGLWPGEIASIDGAAVRERISMALAKVAAYAPAALLLTGDITDTGSETEWTAIKQSFSEGCHVSTVVAVPGNHDVSFNPKNRPDYWLRRRKERERRCADGLGKLMGVPQEPEDLLKLFPRYQQLRADDVNINLLALNSNLHSSDNILSNAVGRFGSRQLQDAAEVLADAKGPLLVLSHHHLGIFGPRRLDFEKLLMSALDAGKLLQLLRNYSLRKPENKVLILHGHRHVFSMGCYVDERVLVAGLPSTTLGEQDDSGRFDGASWLGLIGLSRNRSWRVKPIAVPM